jgi:hypothetical protein
MLAKLKWNAIYDLRDLHYISETYPTKSAARTERSRSDRDGSVLWISEEGKGVWRNQPTFILLLYSLRHFGRYIKW